MNKALRLYALLLCLSTQVSTAQEVPPGAQNVLARPMSVGPEDDSNLHQYVLPGGAEGVVPKKEEDKAMPQVKGSGPGGEGPPGPEAREEPAGPGGPGEEKKDKKEGKADKANDSPGVPGGPGAREEPAAPPGPGDEKITKETKEKKKDKKEKPPKGQKEETKNTIDKPGPQAPGDGPKKAAEDLSVGSGKVEEAQTGPGAGAQPKEGGPGQPQEDKGPAQPQDKDVPQTVAGEKATGPAEKVENTAPQTAGGEKSPWHPLKTDAVEEEGEEETEAEAVKEKKEKKVREEKPEKNKTKKIKRTKAPIQTCNENWKELKKELKYNSKKLWPDPQCYDFTFTNVCNCPEEVTGPFRVKVRGGKVVSYRPIPAKENFVEMIDIPTMNDLFNDVDEYCIAPCPSSKNAPYKCSVTYGELGNIESIFVDIIAIAQDEEISVNVKDLVMCDDAGEVEDSPAGEDQFEATGDQDVLEEEIEDQLDSAADEDADTDPAEEDYDDEEDEEDEEEDEVNTEIEDLAPARRLRGN